MPGSPPTSSPPRPGPSTGVRPPHGVPGSSPPVAHARTGSNDESTAEDSLLETSRREGRSLAGTTLTLADLRKEASYLASHPDVLRQVSRSSAAHKTPPSAQGPSMWSLGSALTPPGSSDKSWTATLFSVGDLIKGYVPASIPFLSGTSSQDLPATMKPQHKRGYWGRTPDELLADAGGRIPPVFDDLRRVILAECMATEGVFRRSSNSTTLPAIIAALDLPVAEQPAMPWTEIARDDPLLPPKILLRLCSQMPEPLVKQSMYAAIKQVTDANSLRTQVLSTLSPAQRAILDHLVGTLHAVSQHEATTRMSPLALAIVVAPTLLAGPDPLEDAALCLAPGKQLPAGMISGGAAKTSPTGSPTSKTSTRPAQNSLVGVLALWIEHYPELKNE